ncbi:MAG: Flp pilus assembly protein CpaB [Asticcacaulis sp.]
MKASRYVLFAVAAVAALLLAFLVHGLVRGKPAANTGKGNVVVEAPTTRVLVAARDLKVGQRITEADLVWKSWPADALNAAYYTDGLVKAVASPEETNQLAKTGEAVAEAADAAINPTRGMEGLLNAVVREPILQNEPITDRKVVQAGQSGMMAVMLDAGKRAMSVPVSVETTAGGFILPGDRVDILVSGEDRRAEGSNTIVTRQVLRNIKVLAIDQNVTGPTEGNTVVGATATLEVTPEEGQALAQARAQGTLALMLRSYADINGPSGRVSGSDPSKANTVNVVRNGQVSEVMVSR